MSRYIAYLGVFILMLGLLVVVVDNKDKLKYKENEVEFIEEDIQLFFTDFDAVLEQQLNSGEVNSIEYSTDDSYLATGIIGALRLRIYKFNPANDLYEYLVGSINTGGLTNTNSVDFKNGSEYLASGHAGGDFVEVWKQSGDTWTNVGFDFSSFFNDEVNDLQFIGSDEEYLVVGGSSTLGNLKMFKHNTITDLFEELTIDSLPTGNVTDINFSKNDYLAVSSDTTPYLDIYKLNGDVLSKVNITNLLTGINSAVALDWNDRGDCLAIGTDGGNRVYTYRFENDDIIALTINDPIGADTILKGVQFIDDTFLYLGGDVGVYKYQFDRDTSEFNSLINDMTTFSAPINVIDASNDLFHVSLGDISDMDLYNATYTSDTAPIVLPEIPYEITSVIQDGVLVDYILVGNTIIVTDDISVSPVTINYTVLEEIENSNIYSVLPIVFGMLVFLGIASMFYRK